MENKIKPFVKWVGGKRQLLNQFRAIGIYPPQNFNIKKNRYFEPFVGGGAIFFDLLPLNGHLSDLNKELIITYNFIKNDVESLILDLKKHVNDKDYFLNIRSYKIEELHELDIASRFLYLNRTSFNGMYRVNKSGGFNVPYGKYKAQLNFDFDNLRNVSRGLANIEIKHQDYKEAVKFAKKGDFIYFDPPYYPLNKTSSFTTYTTEKFLQEQHVELSNIFNELNDRECIVILSNSATPFIIDLYSKIKTAKIHNVAATRAINSIGTKRGKITEIVITNY